MGADKLKDDRKRGFYLIDNDLIDQYGPSIGAYGIAVYNLIARYADGNGENSFPSYHTMTKQLGMSRTKVIQTVELLIKLGLIKKEQRVDKSGDLTSNLYTIAHLGSTPHVPPSTPHVPPSTHSEPQVVHHTYQGSTPHVPDQDTFKKTQLNNDDEGANRPNKKNHPHHRETSSTATAQPQKAKQPTSNNLNGSAVELSDAGPDFARISRILEDNGFGRVIGIMAGRVNAILQEHSPAWVEDAIAVCVEKNVRNLKYLSTILANWKKDGRNGKPTTQAKPPALLTMPEWCLKTYNTNKPQFASVAENIIYEQYEQYRASFQPAH